jgi:RNA-directed DNA polymerase
MRPLGIPVMKDRAMQALYLLALAPIAETTGDESSYGFRTGRSAADAIERCFTVLARRTSAEWILEGDIVSCFDRISHDWLLNHVLMERSILHKWLKAGFMDRSVFYPTESGTPQGGIASPVLANLALDGLEKAIRERFPKCRDRRNRRVYLVRYADDFIVTGASKQLLEDEVMPLVERFLGERGLELSRRKTAVTHIDAGFDFLGQTIRKYRGKLLIKPSKQRTRSFLGLVRERIKANSAASAGELVRMLNPALRGWANYHRHVVSKETYGFVDHQIWKALWQWALRRHPKKSARWVRAKYFTVHKGRQWIFTGHVRTAAGEKKELRLFSVASVPIWRHVLVKSAANPFDPAWEAYFADRQSRRVRDADHDRQWLDDASVFRLSFRHAPPSSALSVRIRTLSPLGADREA